MHFQDGIKLGYLFISIWHVFKHDHVNFNVAVMGEGFARGGKVSVDLYTCLTQVWTKILFNLVHERT